MIRFIKPPDSKVEGDYCLDTSELARMACKLRDGPARLTRAEQLWDGGAVTLKKCTKDTATWRIDGSMGMIFLTQGGKDTNWCFASRRDTGVDHENGFAAIVPCVRKNGIPPDGIRPWDVGTF